MEEMTFEGWDSFWGIPWLPMDAQGQHTSSERSSNCPEGTFFQTCPVPNSKQAPYNKLDT